LSGTSEPTLSLFMSPERDFKMDTSRRFFDRDGPRRLLYLFPMNVTPQHARRWSGMLFLGIALVMLILGQTVLEGRLSGLGFILYWVACFLFTSLAALSAILEILIIRWQSREEQRELIQETLEKVKREEGKKDEDREG
jgi:hypothetical protein